MCDLRARSQAPGAIRAGETHSNRNPLVRTCVKCMITSCPYGTAQLQLLSSHRRGARARSSQPVFAVACTKICLWAAAACVVYTEMRLHSIPQVPATASAISGLLLAKVYIQCVCMSVTIDAVFYCTWGTCTCGHHTYMSHVSMCLSFMRVCLWFRYGRQEFAIFL